MWTYKLWTPRKGEHDDVSSELVSEAIPGGDTARYKYTYGFCLSKDDFQEYVNTVRNMDHLSADKADELIYHQKHRAAARRWALARRVKQQLKIVRAQRVENCVLHNLNAALFLGCGNSNNDADGKEWVRAITLPALQFAIETAQRLVVGLREGFVRDQVTAFLTGYNKTAVAEAAKYARPPTSSKKEKAD